MFALGKTYFTPLGDFMDQHDFAIKEKLADVKDTSSEVKQLEEQANAIIRVARAEISADFSGIEGSFGCEKGGGWADFCEGWGLGVGLISSGGDYGGCVARGRRGGGGDWAGVVWLGWGGRMGEEMVLEFCFFI
ncbi:uncharacterized protein LOC130808237 [Amaranthus tricolor]|uniref:uncharacterized protein LOC130808237 n=1 Tax=Amaranthus tricolor TaxID=29722 RepID=UPI002585B132|nr:uncharacterized protein LOC130808237 [Amaranthus tricolor]